MSSQASNGDLSYALKLLASGRSISEVWREAGYKSRKRLAEEIFALSEKVGAKVIRVIAYSDGASIGNPGEAGCAAVILDSQGNVLKEEYRYLGKTTNNVAEYEGAILALDVARKLGAKAVELRVDSSLLANQITGRYRVRDRRLAGLNLRLKKIAEQFEQFEVTLVKSGENKHADRLANFAITARGGEKAGAG